ncbi:12970_t:CDS:2 [Funneliformis geosporum]|uniref:11991_t:CDS:1 n=1 Tax=Funneliformis geosporum TaxID=1117311 RepID=A0A9W4SD06_9GLOM|nr:11991_t:CDS:2 [Funneliformis geosporum]CAI2164522.1 12970_t:CDS:2 [Funneliformis geosporum]
MNSNLMRRPVINIILPNTPEEKECFTQTFRRICSYLTHRDLSALSCVCKAFYEVLTTFENEIWRISRIKFNLAKGLPPPKDLLEREYAKLFNYSKGCQNCKSNKQLRIYWLPRIRSCPDCIKSNAVREFADLNWWGLPECVFNVAPIISYEFDFKDGIDYYWLPQVYSLAQEYRNLNLSTQGEDALNNWLSTKRKQTSDRLEDAFFRHNQLMNTEFSILFRTSFEPGEWIKMIESRRNDSSRQRIGINEATISSDDQNKVDKAVVPVSARRVSFGGTFLCISNKNARIRNKREEKRLRRMERKARLVQEIVERETSQNTNGETRELSRDKRTKYNLRRYIIRPTKPISFDDISSNGKWVHNKPNLTKPISLDDVSYNRKMVHNKPNLTKPISLDDVSSNGKMVHNDSNLTKPISLDDVSSNEKMTHNDSNITKPISSDDISSNEKMAHSNSNLTEPKISLSSFFQGNFFPC